jgi:LacI family transcriptional regulator
MRHIKKTVNVPTVLIDRRPEGLPFDSVLLNNRAAGRVVTEYLVRSGHRQIAILIGQLDYSTAVERLQGYLDVLEENGIPRDDRLIVQGLFDIEPARQATNDMLSSGVRPTAIFCINNQMTIGVMMALHDQGFRCPQDISVAGVDDLPTASAFSPRLTVAIQPTVEIGEKAVDLLLARLNGSAGPDPVHVVYEPRLMVRDSCRVIG